VVRVPGYRSSGPGSIPGTTRLTEELLERKSSGSCLEIREYGRRDPSRRSRGKLYPQKLALTSPTSGGHSVGIVRSRTQATEFSLVFKQAGTPCKERVELHLHRSMSGAPLPLSHDLYSAERMRSHKPPSPVSAVSSAAMFIQFQAGPRQHSDSGFRVRLTHHRIYCLMVLEAFRPHRKHITSPLQSPTG
jgi:hypothetical protein